MTSSTEKSAPNPPRYRWLKRGSLVFVVTLVTLTILRLVWGYHEQSQLDQLVKDIQSAGHPILFEDLKIERVPDDENMAVHIRNAYALLPTVNSKLQTALDTDWYFNGGRWEEAIHGIPDPVTDNAAYLVQFQPVLEELRQAEALSRADWGVVATRPQIYATSGFLGDLRHLARHLEDAAWRAHVEGDDALALEIYGYYFTLARAKFQPPCFFIDAMVAIIFRRMCAGDLEAMLPKMPADPALRRSLEAMRDSLLDETDSIRGMREGVALDQWYIYNKVNDAISGRSPTSTLFSINTPIGAKPMSYGWSRRLLQPSYQREEIILLTIFKADAHAIAHAENMEEYFSLLGQSRISLARRRRTSEVLDPLMSRSYAGGRSGLNLYHELAQTRMCALAIAIKLYQIDHAGQRPATLQELVPDYIPAIPLDPTAGPGALVQYKPGGAVLTDDLSDVPVRTLAPPGPAILYCLGQDGDDDSGLVEVDRHDGSLLRHSKFDRDNGDNWFLLDADPASP